MKKEIYLGHGLYKYVQVKDAPPKGAVEWKIVELEGGGFIRRPFEIQTESLRMQDELEPIYHPTEYDESDDIEEAKSEEMTEFEKAEYKRKIAGVKKRSVWGDHPDKNLLKLAEKQFFKGEKWEWINDT